MPFSPLLCFVIGLHFVLEAFLVSEARFGASIRPLFLRTKQKERNGAKGGGGGGGEGEETKTIDTTHRQGQSAPRSIRGAANQNAYYVAGRPAN